MQRGRLRPCSRRAAAKKASTHGDPRHPECEAAVGGITFARVLSRGHTWRCSAIAGRRPPRVPAGLFYMCLRLSICFLDNFDDFIVVINDMKKFKIFGHDGVATKLFSLHKFFEFVPEFRADTYQRHVIYLFRLDESQDFEKFVKRAKPAGIKDKRFSRERQTNLAHKKIIGSE